MINLMEKQKTIGIVGGGQLGRMLTLAALPLGFKVIVINPTPGSPASQVGAAEIIADLYDAAALRALAKKSDYVTIEIEHLDSEVLIALAAKGTLINPSPKTISLIQDKFLQKEFLHQAGISVVPFVKIKDEMSAKKALKNFDGKMLIKARQGAYDGRGNMLITQPSAITKAFRLFGGRKLYAEGFVPFTKELAVMVARSMDGETAVYPLVETIHQRNICVEVLSPALISQKTSKKAEAVARKVAQLLDGAGMFCIEMFLTKNGEVLVNEIAPRVHNSGHASIEANHTSQFEQHIRAITGLPLGAVGLKVPAAAMINILGERSGPTSLSGLNEILKTPHVSVHMYGKSPTKIDRKMGHITATAKTLAVAQKRARRARKQLSI